MNYKNIFKRETKVIVYVVICLTLVVIGTSYALFLQVNNNTNNQVVKAGSLTITYSGGNTVTVDENENSNCLLPQSDSDGAGSNGCKFNLSITNTGTLPMEYNLLIYDNVDDVPAAATFVDYSLVRHSLKKQYTVANKNETVTSAKALGDLSTYSSTTKKVLEKSVIEAGETITFALNIWIDDNASTDIIGQYVYLKLDVIGSVYETTICKRATGLHTETCNNTYCTNAGYTSGSTITYGSLGTDGILASGDAFDCDVNKDGVYDATNERFYYVSDYYNTSTKEFETDKAVLIYYNNVINSNGVKPDNTSSSLKAYYTSDENWHGPATAIANLPQASAWSNIKLANKTRAILTETSVSATTGGALPSAFNYSNYATRLLTTQELNKACKITTGSGATGELDNCNYLLENTKYSNSSLGTYGYWLENPSSGNASSIFSINATNRNVVLSNASNATNSGVRPVIEVEKTNIKY